MDSLRLYHELQVQRIELELQNSELQEARDTAETLLTTYTDLYDFAPVGYLSITEHGLILEANLTGAALLGVERGRLIKRRFHSLVSPPVRSGFQDFFQRIFRDQGKQTFETSLLNGRGSSFRADVQAAPADYLRGDQKWCRITISDLTALKQGEDVRRRLKGMAVANRDLQREIVRREKVEMALKKSEAHYAQLFDQSLQMQKRLRHLSRELLVTQEDERKRISRELHDEIVQTLVGIKVHLASLTINTPVNIREFRKKIDRTQRLVEKSVNIVHRFARELRPTMLDDLGLIPALHSFIKEFVTRTGIHVQFKATPEVEQLNNTQRTVLYRVAQSALANVEKHAHAGNIKMSIRKGNGMILLEIQDNGISFDAERVLLSRRRGRLGLLGSRERVEMVGGIFEVRSLPGKGTTVIAGIPLTSALSRANKNRKDNKT